MNSSVLRPAHSMSERYRRGSGSVALRLLFCQRGRDQRARLLTGWRCSVTGNQYALLRTRASELSFSLDFGQME